MGRRSWFSGVFGRRRRATEGHPESPEPGLTTFGDFTHEELAERAYGTGTGTGRLIVQEQVEHTLHELFDRVLVDEHYMRATHRWNENAPDPLDFVPGDVLVLRLLATRPSVQEALLLLGALKEGRWPPGGEQMLNWRLRHNSSVASWLYDAIPYLLPVHDAVGILDSRPPEPDMLAELRLPFPIVTVYFGADLAFDPAFLRWSEGLDEPARRFPAQVAQAAYGGAPPTVAMADLTNGVRTLGGYLSGVTMFADDQGGLADEAVFVVATNPDPTFTDARAKDRARGAIHGRLSRSTLAPLVTHLALAVQWGSWHQPPERLGLPPDPGSREWRKATNTGRFRREERRGALIGVRVLDTERTRHAGKAAATESPRASPAAHLRRGHWRRVRVGPRADWHYEGRWIPPTLVNPSGAPAAGVPVYRLPLPDAARAALGTTEEP
jgi:hypothetical protein